MKKSSLLLVLHYIFIITFYVSTAFFIRSYFSNPAGLLASLQNFYSTYGYQLVFMAGLIEGIFLLNTFIPGTAIILTGAVFARTGDASLAAVILLGVTGFVIGYAIDYVLGKYGWYSVFSSLGLFTYIEKAKGTLERYEKRSLFFGLSSPLFATFIATAAGMLGLPFKRFLISIAAVQLFWTSIYAVGAYFFGMVIVELFIKYFGVAATLVIVVWIIKMYRKKRNKFILSFSSLTSPSVPQTSSDLW